MQIYLMIDKYRLTLYLWKILIIVFLFSHIIILWGDGKWVKEGEGEGSGFSKHTKDGKNGNYFCFLALDIKYT